MKLTDRIKQSNTDKLRYHLNKSNTKPQWLKLHKIIQTMDDYDDLLPILNQERIDRGYPPFDKVTPPRKPFLTDEDLPHG